MYFYHKLLKVTLGPIAWCNAYSSAHKREIQVQILRTTTFRKLLENNTMSNLYCRTQFGGIICGNDPCKWLRRLRLVINVYKELGRLQSCSKPLLIWNLDVELMKNILVVRIFEKKIYLSRYDSLFGINLSDIPGLASKFFLQHLTMFVLCFMLLIFINSDFAWIL